MKRDNQTKNLSLVLVLCLLLSLTQASFFMDCLWWYWQQMVFAMSYGKLLGCWNFGWWIGLLFFDDGGAVIQDCMELLGGGAYVDFEEYHEIPLPYEE